MQVNAQTQQSDTSKMSASEQETFNRLMLMAINILFSLPFYVVDFSMAKLEILAWLFIIPSYFVVTKGNDEISAVAYIPRILFIDCLVIIATYGIELYQNFDVGVITYAYIWSNDTTLILSVGMGIVLGLFVFGSKKRVWMMNIIWAMLFYSFMRPIWSSYDIFSSADGKILLWGGVILFGIWVIATQIAVHVDDDRMWEVQLWGMVLLALFVTIGAGCSEYLYEMLPAILTMVRECIPVLFSWYLSVLVLLWGIFGAEIMLSGAHGEKVELFYYFLYSVMVSYFALNITYQSMFAWRQAGLLLFAICLFWCYKNIVMQPENRIFSLRTYLLALLVSYWLIMHMLVAELWLNVAVLFGFGIWLYRWLAHRDTSQKIPYGAQSRFLWLACITFVCGQVASWHMASNGALETIIMVVLAYLMAIGVTLILTMDHPVYSKITFSEKAKYGPIVLTITTLLCLLSMRV